MNPLDHDERVAICILQSRRMPWRDIALYGQRQTWIRDMPKEVSVMHLLARDSDGHLEMLHDRYEVLRYSHHLWPVKRFLDHVGGKWLARTHPGVRATSLSENEFCLTVSVADSILTLPVREIMAMRVFLESPDNRFLVLTNTSSYLAPRRLIACISGLPKQGVYAGPTLSQGRFDFVSGAFRVLSRDVVEQIVVERRKWDFADIDDVGMGRLLAQIGVPPRSMPSKEFTSMSDVLMSSEMDIDQFPHFRLKAFDSRGSRIDAQLMHALHSKLAQAAG